MAGFIRRFSNFPDLATLNEIEGVDIVDLIPPSIFVGRTLGTVALIGEWPKGPFDTPTVVAGDRTIEDVFGGFSLSMTDPFDFTAAPAGEFTNPFSNGNAFCWLKSKRYRRLVLVRVDNTLAEGVHIQLTGTPTPLAQDVVIPAGTRVFSSGAPDEEFALAQDVVFAEGTDLTAAAFTTFDEDTESYSTRTVADIPVYSVRDTSESLVGDVDSVNTQDLFRAGIGAGTALPSIVVTASTGVLDTAPANASPLTVLTTGTYDTRYGNAIDSLLPSGNVATDNVESVASARESDSIRTALLTHVRDASAVGTGRHALVRPPIGTVPATAQGAAASGVGATRSDRVFYCYPHFKQTIPELDELDPNGAISPTSTILLGGDSAMSTIISNLPPENNPGQSTQNIISGGLLPFIEGLEDDLTGAGQPTVFTIDDYIAFKAAGMAALRRDNRISEWIFQSGVTSIDPVSFPSLTTIKRRRMADFIQDSLAAIALRFNKLPKTEDREDSLVGELFDFLDGLLSTDNPAAQRISDFSVDSSSGNTDALEALGIFVVIFEVRLLSTLDKIVLQTTIGETVTVTAQEATA